jgi:hypothetical protein
MALIALTHAARASRHDGAPMRRVHVNYATWPYFNPATVNEATGKRKSVLPITIYQSFGIAWKEPMRRHMRSPCSACESSELINRYASTLNGAAFDDGEAGPAAWRSLSG